MPQRMIDIKTVHQDHAPVSHGSDPLPSQPHATRLLRWETQFLGEFLDGAPAAELTGAGRSAT
jgi:hypothetical protein